MTEKNFTLGDNVEHFTIADVARDNLGPARELFKHQATGFLEAAQALDDIELLDPSQCRGWSRLDLIVHVRMGLDEMASTAAATTQQPADHDAASYWTSTPTTVTTPQCHTSCGCDAPPAPIPAPAVP